MPVARVIAIANQKGGVGKTTTAVNLGASLAADGLETLIIDSDPQGNASSGVGVAKQAELQGVYHSLIEEQPLDAMIQDTELARLKVVPSSQRLAEATLQLTAFERPHFRLREQIQPLLTAFDYILVDCPPSLDLLTINGLVAADSVLVPVQCEYYAMEGLAKLIETIQQVKRSLNPELDIEGIVFTMYDGRNNLSQQVVSEVRLFLPHHCFETIIPRNIRLSEAPSFGRPAICYDVASRGAQSYLRLARELSARRESAN